MLRREQYQHIQGLFLITSSIVQSYIEICKPISLIGNLRSKNKVKTKEFFNFTESKGLKFDTVIIYPTDSILNYLT